MPGPGCPCWPRALRLQGGTEEIRAPTAKGPRVSNPPGVPKPSRALSNSSTLSQEMHQVRGQELPRPGQRG